MRLVCSAVLVVVVAVALLLVGGVAIVPAQPAPCPLLGAAVPVSELSACQGSGR